MFGIGRILLPALAALTGSGNPPAPANIQPTGGPPCYSAYAEAPPRNTGFWIDTGPTVLDRQTLRLLGCRSRIIVLTTQATGDSLRHLITAAHQFMPEARALLYTWGTRWYPGSGIGSRILGGLDSLSAGLLRTRRGQPIVLKDRAHLANPASRTYRTWFQHRVRSALDTLGADGILLDVVTALPPGSVALGMTAAAVTAYEPGVHELLATTAAAIAPRLLVMNGLWTMQPEEIGQQERLLDAVPAAAVEFFGRTYNRPPTFSLDVLPYLRVMAQHPQVTYMIFGRGARTADEYHSYEDDYLWQRYSFAAYLLGAGTNTMFKYHATFTVDPAFGRNGGLDVFADGDLDFGAALGPYEEGNGVYVRQYEDGIAVVAPPEGGNAVYVLPTPMYTPEGERVQDTVRLRPGTGLLLLRHPPANVPGIHIVFDSATVTALGWAGARPGSDSTGPYMHVDAAPADSPWEHDLLLDPVRRLHPPDSLRLRYRTRDANAAILVSVEVDDASRQHYYCVLRASTGTRTSPVSGPSMESAPHFRSPVTRREPTAEVATLMADGAWHDLMVGPGATADPGACAVRRFAFARLSGSMDVAYVDIDPAGH